MRALGPSRAECLAVHPVGGRDLASYIAFGFLVASAPKPPRPLSRRIGTRVKSPTVRGPDARTRNDCPFLLHRMLIYRPRRRILMSVTRQEPAQGGRAAGKEAARTTPFDAFLKRLSVYARARNDTAWLEWYEEWLKNMPKDDGREDYMKKSKADYEARTGETVEACMDRMDREVLDKIAAIDIDKLSRENIAESLAERTRENIAESLAERTRENIAESLAERTRENIAESLAERTRLNIEEAANKQIMVDNFKIFQREYIGMTIRRSC